MNNSSFTIRITKRVVFKDNTGAILKTYEVGDTLTATAESDHYYVSPMGGIYKDEAVRLAP